MKFDFFAQFPPCASLPAEQEAKRIPDMEEGDDGWVSQYAIEILPDKRACVDLAYRLLDEEHRDALTPIFLIRRKHGFEVHVPCDLIFFPRKTWAEIEDLELAPVVKWQITHSVLNL